MDLMDPSQIVSLFGNSDFIVGLLGVDIPKVITLNTIVELIKTELENIGFWERVRRFGFLLPFIAGVAMCYPMEETYAGMLKCGLMYGAASMMLHDVYAIQGKK